MKLGFDISLNENPYLSKNEMESFFISEIFLMIKSKLESEGHTIVDCSPKNVLSDGELYHKKLINAIRNNLDLFISLNFDVTKEKEYIEMFYNYKCREELVKNFEYSINKLPVDVINKKESEELYILKNYPGPCIVLNIFLFEKDLIYNKILLKTISNTIYKGLINVKL